MAKTGVFLFAVALASILFSVQAMGQKSRDPNPDLQTAFFGSSLTCSQSYPQEKVVVPASIVKRARLKARLMNLLRQSIYDDAKGVINLAREREIADVASKLKQDKAW